MPQNLLNWLKDQSPFHPQLRAQTCLTETEYQAGQRWMVRFGVAASAMDALQAGAVITGYALSLGANPAQVGWVVAIPQLASCFQLFGSWVLSRYPQRRQVTVLGALLSRPGILLIIAAAFMPNPHTALTMLIIGLALRYGFGWFLNASWSSWIRDLVAEDQLGRYFSRRLAWMTLASAGATLLAAVLMDFWRQQGWPEKYGYVLLLCTAFVSAIYTIIALRRCPEPQMEMPPAPPRWRDFRKMVQAPMRNKQFQPTLIFLGCWHGALNLALPFTTVYALQTLQLKLGWVLGLNLFAQIASVISLLGWGRIADEHSNVAVLRLACPLAMLMLLGWVFSNWLAGDSQLVWLAILFGLQGTCTGAFNLIGNNLALRNAPAVQAAHYMGSVSLVTAWATGLAPIIGGQLAEVLNQHLGGNGINVLGWHIVYWHGYFLLAAMLMWLAYRFLLPRIIEPQAINHRTTYRQFGRQLRVAIGQLDLLRYAQAMPLKMKWRRK